MRRIIITSAALMCMLACGGEPSAPVEAISTTVVRKLDFAREEASGVSAGFNLDGLVSGSNDGRTCLKEDFTGPDGTEGVDNELARLLPLIDLAGEGAVEGLIQNAVNEGRLLMFFEILPTDDAAVRLRVRRGDDSPLLGTDGRILAGQTLALHPTDPILGEADATFDGAVLEAGPFALKIPVIVFTQLYEVQLPAANLRFELDEEGHVQRGTVGGGIPIEQLIEILDTAGNFGPEFEELFGDAVRESGDLARDANGECSQMSSAITFQAAPAFIWE